MCIYTKSFPIIRTHREGKMTLKLEKQASSDFCFLGRISFISVSFQAQTISENLLLLQNALSESNLKLQRAFGEQVGTLCRRNTRYYSLGVFQRSLLSGWISCMCCCSLGAVSETQSWNLDHP